jgi:hypothetical protein
MSRHIETGPDQPGRPSLEELHEHYCRMGAFERPKPTPRPRSELPKGWAVKRAVVCWVVGDWRRTTYPSLVEGAKATGLSPAAVSYALKDKRNTAGGRRWRYADEYPVIAACRRHRLTEAG